MKHALLALAFLPAAGCWNGYNDSIDLGTVSIGQQMIDLKEALARDALTQDEYERLKQQLMVLDSACDKPDD